MKTIGNILFIALSVTALLDFVLSFIYLLNGNSQGPELWMSGMLCLILAIVFNMHMKNRIK
jgi:hypothetical protein